MGACNSKKAKDVVLDNEIVPPNDLGKIKTPSPAPVPGNAATLNQTPPQNGRKSGMAEETGSSTATRPSGTRKSSIAENFMLEHTINQLKLDDVYDTSDAVVLGEGMSGRVSTCRHRTTGDLFALKTLSVEKLRVDMAELRQEINIMKRLDHPNIVKVYETFEEDEAFHVVMELCNGGQLVSRLRSHRRGFGEELTARLMTKMIGAILFCHEHAVCHRDVKLDNFVYESDAEDAELKLIDFGLSHVLEYDEERMRDRVGTLTYMAPEVLGGAGGAPRTGYTSACDMWSLGVVAYMLLSGRRPFHSQDREEKKALVRRGAVSFEHEAWRNVSEQARDFVMALLQIDPAKRYDARRALAHPWLQRGDAIELRHERAADEMSRHTLVLRSLQDFASMEALHKVALEVVAFTAPPSSFDELRKLFKAIDVDNSGTITYDEFEAAMAKYPEIPEQHLRRLFDSVDFTHKGEVDYNSFLAATLAAQQRISEPTLRTAFSVLDRDHDGIITRADLIATVGQACTEAEIDEMLAQIDADHERIFYADFQRLMVAPSRYAALGKHLAVHKGNMRITKSLSLGNINLHMEEAAAATSPNPPKPITPRRLSTEPARLSAALEQVQRAEAAELERLSSTN